MAAECEKIDWMAVYDHLSLHDIVVCNFLANTMICRTNNGIDVDMMRTVEMMLVVVVSIAKFIERPGLSDNPVRARNCS